jgi:hypothetical protein
VNKYLKDTKLLNRVLNEIQKIGWNNLIESNENLTILNFKYEENSRCHILKINITDAVCIN